MKVTKEKQSESPVNLGGLTIGKCEPGVAWHILELHPARIWLNLSTAHQLLMDLVQPHAWLLCLGIVILGVSRPAAGGVGGLQSDLQRFRHFLFCHRLAETEKNVLTLSSLY